MCCYRSVALSIAGGYDLAMSQPSSEPPKRSSARQSALSVASRLFYENGARAVGMEQIVAESGIAKTTIYRHFANKDALIAAFLQNEDEAFWTQWEDVLAERPTGQSAVEALCRWIGERVSRDRYRGCPQINLAAEFSDPDHPARRIAAAHKKEMRHRLEALCEESGAVAPDRSALAIALLFDGAFTSGTSHAERNLGRLLTDAAESLLRLPPQPQDGVS